MSASATSPYSRSKPFPARLAVNRLLSGSGSQKETRHLEIDLTESGLKYEVGDALGVFASNHPALVEEIIKAIGATGDEEVTSKDNTVKSFRAALTSDLIITQVSKEFVAGLVEKGGEAMELLRTLSTDNLRKGDLEEYLYGMEYIDFLLNNPSIQWTPEELVKRMRKLMPRLYSISSSQRVVGESVHLTVAAVRYTSHGRQRLGVASTFLAERAPEGVPVPVFVHTAKHFRLPEDPSTNVIMVGPGTGVAPFRAYLQERKATGASGKNWLFFGEQRRGVDFLYEEELTAWEQDGTLARLDLAFSRDTDQKVYVQHRMKESSAEIFAWLEGGAYFYVCGDASRMAKDVDAELHAIVEREGGKSPEEAAEYVEALKKAKRYRRDVY